MFGSSKVCLGDLVKKMTLWVQRMPAFIFRDAVGLVVLHAQPTSSDAQSISKKPLPDEPLKQSRSSMFLPKPPSATDSAPPTAVRRRPLSIESQEHGQLPGETFAELFGILLRPTSRTARSRRAKNGVRRNGGTKRVKRPRHAERTYPETYRFWGVNVGIQRVSGIDSELKHPLNQESTSLRVQPCSVHSCPRPPLSSTAPAPSGDFVRFGSSCPPKKQIRGKWSVPACIVKPVRSQVIP